APLHGEGALRGSPPGHPRPRPPRCGDGPARRGSRGLRSARVTPVPAARRGVDARQPTVLPGGRLLAIRTAGRTTVAAAALLLVAACGEKAIDWNAPENLVLREKSSKVDDKVKLEYVSLVDATAKAVYDALADVEHFPDFIPGVDNVQL